MPRFALKPVGLADFSPANPDHHSFTLRSTLPADQLWARLHASAPLRWCTGIRTARWTSPGPRAVGTTRLVTLATGVRLHERYFHWTETPTAYENAFTVDQANAPLFRRFGERCTVSADGTGSVFTWEFVIEPRLPRPLRPLARRLIRRDLAAIQRDTIDYLTTTPGALR